MLPDSNLVAPSPAKGRVGVGLAATKVPLSTTTPPSQPSPTLWGKECRETWSGRPHDKSPRVALWLAYVSHSSVILNSQLCTDWVPAFAGTTISCILFVVHLMAAVTISVMREKWNLQPSTEVRQDQTRIAKLPVVLVSHRTLMPITSATGRSMRIFGTLIDVSEG